AGLRIWVSGGGCSGFQYGMAFDSKRDDDEVIESNGVKVLIDPMSTKYLEGSQIDFVEGLEGSGFKINNPNVKSTCACGTSFET
ncbi:MAG: iron-sulfur cluster insertion protein ErpA, partial [Candidatus Bathyarchaeia archaeon]